MAETPEYPEYTPEARKLIVEEHMATNDGIFKPVDFLTAARSPNHPAHAYFEWDENRASHQWRLHQARTFATIRVVPSKIEEVHDLTAGTVKVEIMPAFVSPIPMRCQGGGYISTDTPEGKDALREEARAMLSQWMMRFGSVLTAPEDKLATRLLKTLPKANEGETT